MPTNQLNQIKPNHPNPNKIQIQIPSPNPTPPPSPQKFLTPPPAPHVPAARPPCWPPTPIGPCHPRRWPSPKASRPPSWPPELSPAKQEAECLPPRTSNRPTKHFPKKTNRPSQPTTRPLRAPSAPVALIDGGSGAAAQFLSHPRGLRRAILRERILAEAMHKAIQVIQSRWPPPRAQSS